MFLWLVGERQTKAAEELKPCGVAARGWVLIADRGAAGMSRGKAQGDQGAGAATEVEQQPAAGATDVVDLDDFKAVSSLFIDVVDLYLFQDRQSGSLALFTWHTESVCEPDRLGSILPRAGCPNRN